MTAVCSYILYIHVFITFSFTMSQSDKYKCTRRPARIFLPLLKNKQHRNQPALFRLWSAIILITLFAWKTNAAPHYLNALKTEAQFSMLEGEPLSQKYGGITAVKVLYDIKNKSVYFINSKRYKFHFEFARSQLAYQDDLYKFNENNYHPNLRREYVFATINHYKGSNLYTYEFASSEKMSAEAFLSYEMVKKKIFVGDQLRFFPATAEQITDTKKLDATLNLISAAEVFQHIHYQPIVAKESYGYLRRIELGQLNKSIISKRDIILLNGTPNEVPLSAGVITSQLQPPLSHINILCHNRGTPMMASRTIWDNQHVASLSNQLVHLIISHDTFSIEKANIIEAQAYWAKSNRHSVSPVCDLSADTLIDLKYVTYNVLKFAGGKAAGFAELMKVQKKYPADFMVPAGAFAIPFYFYQQHIQHPEIAALIAKLYADSTLQTKPDILKKNLKAIRKAIRLQPVNELLIQWVKEKMIAANCGPAFRFRSSTNAEDLPGFNGAGLYDSKTARLNDSTKTIEKAISAVWASLWNDRAYLERQYFGIPQQKVMMGILCHAAMGTEEVNGVAITRNIYRPEMSGNVINMQQGESSIVLPSDSVVSEHTILLVSHTWGEPTFAIDYISYSSLNNNRPLLTEAEYKKLSLVLSYVKAYFYKNVDKRKTDLSKYALDIEFKYIGPNRKLVLKQARVYND